MQRQAIHAIVAVVVVAAVGLGAVAFSSVDVWGAAVRSCVQTAPIGLAVGLLVLLFGLVVAFSTLRPRRSRLDEEHRR